MYKNQDIVNKIVNQTLFGDLNWKLLNKTNISTVYISKKYLSKDKYLAIYLNIYEFDIDNTDKENDVILQIELTSKRSTIEVKKMISEFYPKVLDICEIVSD